jgi:hypothetical protein
MVMVTSGRAVRGRSRGTVVGGGRRTRGAIAIVNVSHGQVGITETHEVLNIEEGMHANDLIAARHPPLFRELYGTRPPTLGCIEALLKKMQFKQSNSFQFIRGYYCLSKG